MWLTARERRVLADLERQFTPRRRHPARTPAMLAVSWLVSGLLFAALLSDDWIPAAVAGALALAVVTWQLVQARP